MKLSEFGGAGLKITSRLDPLDMEDVEFFNKNIRRHLQHQEGVLSSNWQLYQLYENWIANWFYK